MYVGPSFKDSQYFITHIYGGCKMGHYEIILYICIYVTVNMCNQGIRVFPEISVNTRIP